MQTIFPLDNQGNALKLTTAFYYLPFGRCINKPENGIKGLKLQEEEDSEEEEETKADSAKKDTVVRDTFYTNNGRMMFGGGGISPDVDIELSPMPWVVQVQERMAMYFKFAVKARPGLDKAGIKMDANWEVPDSLYTQFKDYCMKDTNFMKVKSNALIGVDQLEKSIIREQNYMGDSSKTVTDTTLAKRLAEMRKALENKRDAQFDGRPFLLTLDECPDNLAKHHVVGYADDTDKANEKDKGKRSPKRKVTLDRRKAIRTHEISPRIPWSTVKKEEHHLAHQKGNHDQDKI